MAKKTISGHTAEFKWTKGRGSHTLTVTYPLYPDWGVTEWGLLLPDREYPYYGLEKTTRTDGTTHRMGRPSFDAKNLKEAKAHVEKLAMQSELADLERHGNPPPDRLSKSRESVIGLYPASGGDERFYSSTDEGLRNAVSSSLNMAGEPSHFRQYQGDGQGGWKSSELVKVTTEVVDPNRYEYPVRSANPHYDISDWGQFEAEGRAEGVAQEYGLDAQEWTFPGIDYIVGRISSRKDWEFGEAQAAFTKAAVRSVNRWVAKHSDQAHDLLASDDTDSEDDIAWNVWAGFEGHGVGFWEHMDADDYESLAEHLSEDKQLAKAYQDMEQAIETAAREGFPRSGNPMPKAYAPEVGYRYQILRRPWFGEQPWEHLAYAVGEADRRRLLQDYRQAYGDEWQFNTIQLPETYWPKASNPRSPNAYLGDAVERAKQKKYGYPKPPTGKKRKSSSRDREVRKIKNRVLK